MSFGLWIAPAVMAGLFAFVWFATWLERLVPLPAIDETWSTESLDSVVTGTSAHAEPIGTDGLLADPDIAAA
ncbi:MAG: hypothetical protein ACYDH6_17815 [Acidimicrobiales bacterium]